MLRIRGLWRHDPGPCPVDDAPHTTCTAPGPIVVRQLPARDALVVTPPLRAEEIQATLPPNQFTTGTYRGKRRRR